MKRTYALLLALLMMTALLAGCSKDAAEPAASVKPAVSAAPASQAPAEPESLGGVYPICEPGSYELSIWYPLAEQVSPYIQDLANGDNYAWNAAMEKTGISIKFIHPASMNSNEQFQMMVASGDYTDIINSGTTYYTGGADKAVDDEVFLDLRPFQDLMPNYMKWVNIDEYNQKNAYTDTGRMPFISQVYDRTQAQFLGYTVRKDWLDDLGMSLPVTIDDWTNMLTAFKEQKTTDGAAPLELQSSGVPASHFFIGAYGAKASDYFIQMDGTIHFTAMEDGYREYLKQMNSWYKSGLIDPDFATNGGFGFTPQTERVATGKSGAVPMMYTWAGAYMASSGMAPTGANFAIAPIPKLNPSDELLVNFKSYTTLVGGGHVVTTACDKPDYAVRFIDWFYSEEGSMIANYGIEGVTFNYNEKGKPIHTDLIAHNPDGMTSTYAQQRYLIHNGFMLFILDREEDVQSEDALKYRDLWGGVGKYNIMGTVYYTTEEGTERSAILTDVNTYVSEFTLNAIQGIVDVNDDAVWNGYVNTIKSQNIDRAIEITQGAYDRLLAR